MSDLARQLIEKEKKERTGKLDLGNCGLTDLEKEVPELFELAWLEELILSNSYWDYEKKRKVRSKNKGDKNVIARIPLGFADLYRIEKLVMGGEDLSEWKISKLENLPETLTTFYINDNQVSKLENLPKTLTSLYISNNQVSKLENLPEGLASIDISENRVSKLENLPEGLISLTIRYNRVSKLENLPEGLVSLNIQENRVNKLENLPGVLTSLNIRYSQVGKLENLPEALTSLEITGNRVSKLENLPEALTYLEISRNPIGDLSPITNLIKKGIQVEWSWDITSNEGIFIYDCPLIHPPIEIVKRGNAAILNYFRQLEEEQGKEDYLFETKLLIIGEAGAGKTTFARRIQQADAAMPGEGDSTHGIHVDRWEFDVPTGTFKELNHLDASFHVNLWDFGGQEVYHGTHQFFFSKKSLYVLLCDTREQKTDFRYWLNTVEQLCGEDAHLFILFNRREDHDWHLDAGFRERFKQLIKEEYSLDLSIVESIPELQHRIKGHLQRLPDVGQKLIQSWVDIREGLANETDNDISFDRFKEICAAHKRTRPEDIENISRYFTRIGVFTHYMDDLVLRERVYLNSNHLVKTIYQLLDNADIKAFVGRIGKAEIEGVWEKLGFEKERLPRLLEKFGLMYQVPKRAEYIVPEHLPDGVPYVHWSHEKAHPQLHFRYEFDKYMPKGLMSRLIVALHRYIGDHSLVWRRGVNISFGNAHAEITESLGGVNRFDIRIAGDFRRDLLVIITQAFDLMLSDFQKLSVSREVRCPCAECQNGSDAYFHKMKDIEQALIKKTGKSNPKAGKSEPTVECKVSYDDVEIVQLLGMVNFEWVLERTEERSREMGVHIELQNIKSILREIKSTTDETNSLVKKIHKDLLAVYVALQDDLTHISGQVFDSTQEEKQFFQKIEKRLTSAEKDQIPWHDNDLKHKIKVTLPLLFVKYEAEMEVGGFQIPKSWKEFKRWFIKDAPND